MEYIMGFALQIYWTGGLSIICSNVFVKGTSLFYFLGTWSYSYLCILAWVRYSAGVRGAGARSHPCLWHYGAVGSQLANTGKPLFFSIFFFFFLVWLIDAMPRLLSQHLLTKALSRWPRKNKCDDAGELFSILHVLGMCLVINSSIRLWYFFPDDQGTLMLLGEYCMYGWLSWWASGTSSEFWFGECQERMLLGTKW